MTAPAVVYIDDEAILCRVFQRILDRKYAPAVTFTDPERALAFAHTNRVAAVICDYRMPTMSGLEVLARLEIDVPFFLVSGDIAITALVENNPRVTAVLPKPFSPEDLLALLEPHLPTAP